MSDEPAEAGAVIRLLVAEDTRILRETLVTLFSLEDGIEVVAQVAAGTGIVPAASFRVLAQGRACGDAD